MALIKVLCEEMMPVGWKVGLVGVKSVGMEAMIGVPWVITRLLSVVPVEEGIVPDIGRRNIGAVIQFKVCRKDQVLRINLMV